MPFDIPSSYLHHAHRTFPTIQFQQLIRTADGSTVRAQDATHPKTLGNRVATVRPVLTVAPLHWQVVSVIRKRLASYSQATHHDIFESPIYRPIYAQYSSWDSTQGTFLCGVITPPGVLNLACYVASTEPMDPCSVIDLLVIYLSFRPAPLE